jgi:hypothetical protein
LDGYTLIRDPDTSEICYARLSADRDRLESTGVRIGDQPASALNLTKHLRINPKAAQAQAAEARAYARLLEEETMQELGLLGVKLAPPSTGNVKGICLLIDFDDEPATIPAANVEDYCNLPGYTGYGNNG